MTCGGSDDDDERMKRSVMAGDDLAVVRGAADDGLMHRGHRRVPGRRRLIHGAEELERIEARRAEDRAAARQRRQHAGDQSVDVEQRHDVERAIRRRELEHVRDVVGGRRRR